MLFFSSLSVQSLVVVIDSKKNIKVIRTMVLDDKASAFLLQVRQAMAASSGSPVSAETIPLEEVAAAVEASGGGFSSVLNEVAAATLSNSVSILIFYISFLIHFFFLKSVSELDFEFFCYLSL
jgi:hypothetical protein